MLLESIPLIVSLAAPSLESLHLTNVPLPGMGLVSLELTRFETLTSDCRIVSDSADSSVGDAARSVSTFHGTVTGFPGASAYMALSPRGVVGLIEIEGHRFAMAPAEGTWHAGHAWRGMVRGPMKWVESPSAGAPLLEEVCRALPNPHGGDGGIAGSGAPQDVRGKRVRIAADCDYEFTTIFADTADASAYVVSLYGAISDVYWRECRMRVELSFMRFWTTPADPFNDPDPLNQFRTYWEQNEQAVVRDVAQLLTGRRNLPYGGVAWLNAACTDFGYSVTGYLIGSFADPGKTNPGNWDIIVIAHELGHNVGTLHTHDYGIDTCNTGTISRGTIMSYCHTVSGATANIDLGFHVLCRNAIFDYCSQAPCLGHDCDGDGIEDLEAIAAGIVLDTNGDGIPDGCQDCNQNGIPDPVEIAAGLPDIDGNGIPDDCDPDCNGNGIPDSLDIAMGTSIDLWGNGIPDECEQDCNGNGISDYNEIQANMSLDKDRNGILDSCQDCDHDGILDATVLNGALNWWVSSASDGKLRELHGRSGVRLRETSAAPASVIDLALAPAGYLCGTYTHSVAKFDLASGQYIGDLVTSASGGLKNAQGILFRQDGVLLVASAGTNAILKYNATGAPLGALVPTGSNGLVHPFGMAIRSDGVLAVSCTDGRVRGYDSMSGAFVGILADLSQLSASSDPTGVLYLPSGDLIVASRGRDSIERFDGVTGAYKGRFDVGPSPGNSIALKDPVSMKLIAKGKAVLVTATTSGAALVGLDSTSGYHLRTYRVYPTDAPSPMGLYVMPASPLDCNENFIPDSCDIASGFSSDVNGDGIPDECQTPAELADLNGDGHVDGADLGILLSAWGSHAPGDLNGDGVVDGADLGMLLAAWTG